MMYNGENVEEVLAFLRSSKNPEIDILVVDLDSQSGELTITYRLSYGYGPPHIDSLWINRRDELTFESNTTSGNVLFQRRAKRP